MPDQIIEWGRHLLHAIGPTLAGAAVLGVVIYMLLVFVGGDD